MKIEIKINYTDKDKNYKSNKYRDGDKGRGKDEN